MKRAAIFLACLAMLFLFTGAALADTDGDYEYSLLSDGTAWITGYTGPGGDIAIPQTLGGHRVTVIGGVQHATDVISYDVFENNQTITSVTIPEGVTGIGKYAFKDCANMTSLTLPDSLELIGNFAFAWCQSLREVTIPSGVTKIGESAFTGCYSMETLTINARNVELVENPFTYATSLSRIVVPEGTNLTVVDGALVERGPMRLVTLPVTAVDGHYTVPDGVRVVGDMAFFAMNDLTQVTLPASVEEIGYSAFGYCEALTYVDARPSALRRVGYCAFLACSSLSEVALPDTVTEIEDNAFDSCPAGLVIRTGSDSVAALCESLGLTVAR